MTAVHHNDCSTALGAIHTADCAAAVWQRELATDFHSWLEGLDPSSLPKGRAVIARSEIREALTELCEVPLTVDATRTQTLIDDAARLADEFAETWARSSCACASM